MFKKGFTLAEVLVTLGIVGVVAAMTLPSLRSNAQAQSIGPKLAKIRSVIENANKMMIQSYDGEHLCDIGLLSCATSPNDGATRYAPALTNFIKIAEEYSASELETEVADAEWKTGTWYRTSDGMAYFLGSFGNIDCVDYTLLSTYAAYKVPLHGIVYVDINGRAKPNYPGVDIFAFHLMLDGSLHPYGEKKSPTDTGSVPWKSSCKVNESPTNGLTCTAHIFANNLKVRYKM